MPDERLRSLMQDLYDAHRAFREELEKWWGRKGTKSPEPEAVTKARDQFWDALNRLFDERLYSLWENFSNQKEGATDAVIDFLEIDIPAHRCGYIKEKFLRKLKSVELTGPQQTRLKEAALELVSSGSFRRELGDWWRLMINLADEEFVTSLRDIIRSLDTGSARGAERMLKVVLEHRLDLQRPD